MKKIICLLAAILVLGGAAFAEEPLAAFAGVEMKLDEEVHVDLDGDGTQESLMVTMVGPGEEKLLNLYVTGASGEMISYETYITRYTSCFAADLDHDGWVEILLSGDEWSWDFSTTCLRYTTDGKLEPVLFPDVGRFPGDEPYAPFGYGMVTGISEDGIITLTGSQDVLGTWMASREFDLIDGRFELVEGMFMIDIAQSDWTDRPLILKQDIDVGEGNQAIPLKKGDLILPVASDLKSFVLMTTESGRTFQFDIQLNEEYGWGWIVNGINEDDLFEYVPYAD